MPSSYTANARFTLQATGENNNTWGAILNSGVFQLVDDAINGHLALALSGNHTLTTANGATDEQRMGFIDVTSGTGGQLLIGAAPKKGVVRNNATGPVFSTVGGSQGVSFAPGDIGPIFSDGANVYGLQIAGLSIKDYIAQQSTGAGNLPSPIGGAGKALLIRDAGSGPFWTPDFVGAVNMGPGAAVGNIGYTPANVAGQVFTGAIQAPSIGFSGTRFSLYALGAGGGVSQIAWDNIAGTYETVDWTTGLWSFVKGGLTLSTLDVNGNVTFAGSLTAASISGATLANGSVTAAKLAPGAAVGNIGYTPANKAGDTFTGPVAVIGGITSTGISVGSGATKEIGLSGDGATVSQLTFWGTQGYYFRLDYTNHTLTYAVNGTNYIWSLDNTGNMIVAGNGSFGGTLSYHNSLTGAGANAVGILHTYVLDGVTRWIQGISPAAVGDMQWNNYTAGGVYVATPLRLGLADSSVNVGPAGPLNLTRAGQGVWWQNGSAQHLNGDQPGITFNHANAGVKIVIGQTPSGRLFAFAKGDSTPANFSFDLNSGIGTATTWTSTSDRRLKFDLKPLAHGLDVLATLSPFTFGQAQTEADAKAKHGIRSAGLVAQDLLGTPLETLLQPPTDDRAYYALDYAGLSAWYVAAFKEIAGRLADLTARVEALEGP
jgi:hypothetical protein